ncbi:MAG: hypothetical protein WB677_07575 [Xanthobacteraceae bacterium]
MGEWLVADLSVLDIHFQAWMLLVMGIFLLWLLYAWSKNGLYKVLCAGNLQKARAIFEQATKRGIGSRG